MYAWTPDIALSMPARTFFAMLTQGREQEWTDKWTTLGDLCDLFGIPLGDSKYLEEVRRMCFRNAFPGRLDHKKTVFDLGSPELKAELARLSRG